MKTSDQGRAQIEVFEGLTTVAYRRDYGAKKDVPTIGYGHTRGVKVGDKCTVHEADMFLSADLLDAENAVNHNVFVPMTQSQFDMLVSLAFNIGDSHDGFAGSTTLHLLNALDYHGAAEAFSMWRKVGDAYPDGQRARRAREQRIFLVGY